jgi:hypothetical protein
MRQMGQGYFWQRIAKNDLYGHGQESLQATQGLLLRKKIEDASGQNQVTFHLSTH